MTSLQEIKKAKELGKKLRIAREKQGLSLAATSSQCGISVIHLLSLEAGSHFVFNNDIEELYACAERYAAVLQMDTEQLESRAQTSPMANEKHEQVIPHFLRKKY